MATQMTYDGSLQTTEEKAYYLKYISLLSDGGKLALLEKFASLVPHSDIGAHIKNEETYMRKLLKQRAITISQFDCMFPMSGQQPDPLTFDISLLTVLLRKTCLTQSNFVWDIRTPPSASDLSVEADIMRLMIWRNKYIGHPQTTEMTKLEFEDVFSETEEVLMRLGSNIPCFKTKIDDLKTNTIDPLHEAKLLDNLYGMGEVFYEVRHTMEQATEQLNQHLRNLPQYGIHQLFRHTHIEQTGTTRTVEGNMDDWDQALDTENNAIIEQLLRYSDILPKDQHVQRAYGLYQEKKLAVDTMDNICLKICEHVKTKSENITSVNACYKADGPDLVMFVAMADKEIKVDFEYKVRVCHPEGYSYEGSVVTYHDERKKKKFTTEESKEILATIQEHSNELFSKHSNLQIIDGCSVKSQGFGTNSSRIVMQTCVVLYVNVKGLIPLHEERLPTHLPIPGTGSYISVDVREGGMRYLCKPNDYHQQLKMGCQILTDGKCSGTIGTFFEKNGKTYCLTSAHVFFDNEQFKQTLQITGKYNRDDYAPLSLDDMNIAPHPAYEIPVYQNEKVPGNQIGVVTEAVLNAGSTKKAGMDIAVIEITEANRLPTEGSFPDGNYERAGFDQPMVYTTGKVYNQASFRDQTRVHTEVVKYGSQTEITRGVFDLEGPCVRRTDFIEKKENNQQGWRLNNQLTVLATGDQKTNPFSIHGDSGALVFAKHDGNASDLRAVGVLEGQMSNDKTVITPIWDICEYLKISLKTFHSPFVNQDVVSADASSPSSTTVERSNDRTYQELQEVKQNQQRQNDKLEAIEQGMKENAESVETKFNMILTMLSKNNP